MRTYHLLILEKKNNTPQTKIIIQMHFLQYFSPPHRKLHISLFLEEYFFTNRSGCGVSSCDRKNLKVAMCLKSPPLKVEFKDPDPFFHKGAENTKDFFLYSGINT